MGARDSEAPSDAVIGVRVIGVRVIGVRLTAAGVTAVRTANRTGHRNGTRQDGPQSGSQIRRRIQATLGDGRWLTQEHDRHRSGDPAEHARSARPGTGHAGSGRVRICGGLVRTCPGRVI